VTTFPALVPSSRTFTPGEYPATAFSGFSGAQNRVRHSNVLLAAQLRLTFLGLTQAQMLDIWNHYSGRRGQFRSFDLPVEVVSYGSITDYVPGNYLWRYAGPGSVEDLPCGGHNVSLTLETVPPVAASVVGADLFLRLRLSAGVAAGGEYAPGINEAITLSVTGGAAFVAQNGIDSALTLSLETGEALGDASVNGFDDDIYLTLATSGAANTGANGINETISLTLTTGSAVGATDPNFSNVSLLLHMDGSDGSTTFTDSSSNALTVTANGNAQISTAQSKFGGSSLRLSASGDFLSLPAVDGLGLNGDFTVELWLRTLDQTDQIICGADGGTNHQLFRVNYPSAGRIFFYIGSPSYQMQSASSVINVEQFHHLAFTRSSDTAKAFVDGIEVASITLESAISVQFRKIGNLYSGAVNAHIDEVRVTKGVARYQSAFTPPTAAFPNS